MQKAAVPTRYVKVFDYNVWWELVHCDGFLLLLQRQSVLVDRLVLSSSRFACT